MTLMRYYFLLCCITISVISYSQIADTSLEASLQLPEKYYSKVDKKIKGVNDQLTKKSLAYLAKFQKQERRLQDKIKHLNPPDAFNVLPDAQEKYKELSGKIKSKTAGIAKVIPSEYSPYMDSLGSSLFFLKQYTGIGDKVKEPLKTFDLLQDKLQQSEKIKEFIAERKNQIKELLSKYTKIPASLKNGYTKLSKTAYYYSAQVKAYKDMLKDPKKVEQQALNVLTKLPAFQKFIKENGQLASLFRINENLDPLQSLAGLQTRNSAQGIIQQRIAAGGPNAMSIVQQNIAQAAGELTKLKDKVNQFGGGSSDIEMPDFKPSDQKTKKFLQRLEYTTDLQFAKTNKLLPSAANIGLGIGYKLKGSNIVGIGISYKMGMGSIQHISISNQGLGFRGYGDYKLKGSLFISGGYEWNYNTAFKNIEQLKNYSAWQRSALAGVSKRYKISKKVKGSIKLLYDFLANQHIPVSPAVIFRSGYNF